jgi:PAS domain S-box-containing protein
MNNNSSGTPLNVLIVEDSPDDADLMVLYLRKEGFKVDWTRVENERAYLSALDSPHDLILSDWSLPQFSGLLALKHIRERRLEMPFIIVSGGLGEEAAVAAMHLGATDYLLKDRMERLGQAVRNALEQKQVREQYRKSQEALAASEAELRALFAALHDVVLVFDRDGVYQKIAPTNPGLLAKPAVELLGKKLEDVFSQTQAAEFLKTIQKVLETQQIEYIEYEISLGNRQTWFETSISPMTADSVIWVARDITERKQNEATLLKHLHRQAQVAALGRELANMRELTTICRASYHTLRQMIGCVYFAVALMDAESHTLQTVYAALEDAEFDTQLYPFLELGSNHSASISSQAIQTRTPIIISDPSQLRGGPIGIQTCTGHDMHSACCLPMLAEGQVIGLIELQNSKEHEYLPEDFEWLNVVANQVGLSIQNARLFSKVEQRVNELMALHTIDSAVAAHLSPRETLEIAIEQLMICLGVDAAAILRFNSQHQSLEYALGRGFNTSAVEKTHLLLGDTLMGEIAPQNRLIKRDELRGGLSFLKQKDWIPEGFISYIGTPLIVNSRLIGVCEIYHRSTLRLDADWLRTLETLAGQAALVIDHLQIFEDLQQANAELLEAYDATITGWSLAMDLRDKDTENHTRRVTELTVHLAKRLGMEEDQIIHLRRGALLHDIGKLGVPDKILSKPDHLTEEEWVVMQRHPQLAYEMLLPIEYLYPALEIPYCHHEKWDGSGYPRGLKGEQIPFAARLFALADVYDALTSDRPYRKAWRHERVLEYLRDQSGKHFDPRVVDVFLSAIHSGELNNIFGD